MNKVRHLSSTSWLPVAIILALALIDCTGQFRDIYRAYAITPKAYAYQIVFSAVSVCLLLWIMLPDRQSGEAQHDDATFPCSLADFLPFVTLAVLGTGLVLAGREVAAEGPQYYPGLLRLQIIGYVLVAGSLAGSLALYRTSRSGQLIQRAIIYLSTPQAQKARNVAITLLVAVFLLAPFNARILTAASLLLGPLAIALIALSIYLFALQALSRACGWLFPIVVALLVGASLLWHWIGTNDNHEIRSFARTNEPVQLGDKYTFKDGRIQIEKPDAAFESWYNARRALRPGKTVPVFLVSAQGGGLYAARHAASVLARLQDECAAFGQHVFAISGVSGGSVGASVFAAAMSKNQLELAPLDCVPSPEKPYQTFVAKFLERDFLSPTLWLAALPDLVQRFIPFPAIQKYDRALGLEYGLERADQDTGAGTFFDRGMMDSWSSQRAVPALFLNTARVGTGGQDYVAPIHEARNDRLIQNRMPERDIRISTAVGLSARFPVLASTGRIPEVVENWRSEKVKITTSYVDGGYAENSGLDTSLSLFMSLARVAQDKRLDVVIHLVVISESSELTSSFLTFQKAGPQLSNWSRISVDVEPRSDGSHFLDPVAAILKARQHRPAHARANAITTMQMLRASASGKIAGKFMPFSFTNFADDIPLGWIFSKLTHDRIAHLRSGTPRDDKSCMREVTKEVDHLLHFGERMDALQDAVLMRCNLRDIQGIFGSVR